MTDTSSINLAIIGLGNMGTSHLRDVTSLENTTLVAVCDIDQNKANDMAEHYDVPAFYDYESLLDKAELDAILISTPHYDHTPITIAALSQGINVLVEKPIAVHAKDARKMITAYEEAKKKYPDLVWAAMFQQRTYGFWQKIKEMIDTGELGKLVRCTWIITDWFRTQSYYDNGGWRATWAGEGGGVLLNQCPHNLDLYQWFVGLPNKVAGFAQIGKYHHIEVEDEVTGYFEYDNGMVGHFMTTTAESPGTNRLEIVGENGKLVFENGELIFHKNKYSMFKQIKEAEGGFAKVEKEVIEVEFEHHGQPGHKIVTENFANAILNGETLIAPASEGLNSVMLGNAIMFSSFLGQPITLPFDEDAYADKLKSLAENSDFEKKVRETGAEEDMASSF